jgi:hypothetical protein
VAVTFTDEIVAGASSIGSATSGRHMLSNLPSRLWLVPEPQVTRQQIDALVGPATPHFAYQLRARVEELVLDLPEDDEVRRYGEEKMELLDRLGYASSKAQEGPRVPRDRPGWEEIPSSAPADEPLPPLRR